MANMDIYRRNKQAFAGWVDNSAPGMPHRRFKFCDPGKEECTYSFAKTGDTLPAHAHDATIDITHDTRIVRGSFRVIGARAGLILNAGDYLPPWPLGEVHGFVALADDSVLVNTKTYSADEH